MKKEKFIELWKAYVLNWWNLQCIDLPDGSVSVSELCLIKKDACKRTFEIYNIIKRAAKRYYFRAGDTPHLSRYKRAAALSYSIIISDPLYYITDNQENVSGWIDKYFLKQRLAVNLALGSIIQDFPSSIVDEHVQKGGTIYDFSNLGDGQNEDDDFLLSLYKDLLYSELYNNYNMLTMANVYGLLTEKASILGRIQNDNNDNNELE